MVPLLSFVVRIVDVYSGSTHFVLTRRMSRSGASKWNLWAKPTCLWNGSLSGWVRSARKIAFWHIQSLKRIEWNKDRDPRTQFDRSSALKATHPRDKVCGLLGISTQSLHHASIIPIYSKSVWQVFIEASCSTSRDKGTDLLYTDFPLYPPFDRPLRSSTALSKLPSWALDLIIIWRTQESSTEGNHQIRSLPSGVDREWLTQSIRCLPPYIRFSATMEQMHTVGLHLGTVAACSGNLIYDSHPEPPNGYTFPLPVCMTSITVCFNVMGYRIR